MTIKIWQCVYDIFSNTSYNIAGYYHAESREIISFEMSNKHKELLINKGTKFFDKYGTKQIFFTYGRDINNRIEVISICHPVFDISYAELGERITIGRIKRMRGDIQKITYEKEEFEKKIKLYDKKYDGFNKIETIYKTITSQRIKTDINGNPVIARKIRFKPYNLDKRYPTIKHRDGTEEIGKLMYPYIDTY